MDWQPMPELIEHLSRTAREHWLAVFVVWLILLAGSGLAAASLAKAFWRRGT